MVPSSKRIVRDVQPESKTKEGRANATPEERLLVFFLLSLPSDKLWLVAEPTTKAETCELAYIILKALTAHLGQ